MAALCALPPGSRRSLAVRAADFRQPVCRLVPIFSELNHGAQRMFFTLPLWSLWWKVPSDVGPDHTHKEGETVEHPCQKIIPSISVGMNQISSSSGCITKSWVIDFSCISTQAVSFRVSRCSLWLILLEGSGDNWNIPCITCQRGWKRSVIYNNRPLEVMFLSLPPVAESSLRISFSLSGLRSVDWTRVGMDFICC